MPVDESVLGFSNKWYKEAFACSITQDLSDATRIKVISAPYFLATKLEAFKGRGNQDFLLSHDLEDIISLVDGRSEIIEDVSQASQSVRQYLSQEFALLMNNENFLQALPGHLNYSNEIFVREKIVKGRINAIIDLDL